jgi:hypothetical protein
MHSSGAVPDKLRITYIKYFGSDRIEWEARDETVLNADPEQALWLQHPAHGRKVDVVALTLRNIAGCEFQPYDLESSFNPRVGPSEPGSTGESPESAGN